MNKNILITGGAGFIGINTAKFFLEKGANVTILDNFSRKGSRENIKWLLSDCRNKPVIIEADIVTDQKILAKAIEKTDTIFHFAAQVAVTSSITDPRHDFNVNLLGTFNILEAIRNSKNKPVLLYSSTNKVYGDLESLEIEENETRYILKKYPGGIPESFPVKFKSPYGCSKGAADLYIQDYHNIYGIKAIVFRQSCIYGQRQFGIEDQGWIAWFLIALMSGKKVTIYGDGKQVRDLLFIDDLVRAYDLAVDNLQITNGQVYNIGGGPENSISVWAELKPIFEKLFNKEIKLNYADTRSGDQKIYISNINKAKQDFNWQPEINIKQGINKIFNWVKENKKMLSGI